MNFAGKRRMILRDRMPKVILILAIPIMLNNLIQTLYNLADTFWVSRLGTVEVAAVSFVWPVSFLLISIGMGMNIAGTSMISQYIGSEDMENAKLVAGQLFSFSMIISIVFGIMGYFGSPLVLRLMGAEGDLLKYSTTYLKIMFLELPFLFTFFIYTSIKQGEGDTVTPTILTSLSVILNVLLDPYFILDTVTIFGVTSIQGLGLGIGGAATATVLSKVPFAGFAIYKLFTNTLGVSLKAEYLPFRKNVLLKIIKVGVPASLGQSGAALGFMILNAFVVFYGANTLAAFGIGNRINSIFFMPAAGIGTALVTVVGQNLGADQIERAKLAFRTSALMSIGFMFIGGVVLHIFARNVVGIFTTDMDVLHQGSEYLKLIASTLVFIGIFQTLLGVFRGSGHTIYAMVMDMGRLWGLRIPMILFFQHFTNWGSESVWYSMVLSNILICAVGGFIYFQGHWQKKIVHIDIPES